MWCEVYFMKDHKVLTFGKKDKNDYKYDTYKHFKITNIGEN